MPSSRNKEPQSDRIAEAARNRRHPAFTEPPPLFSDLICQAHGLPGIWPPSTYAYVLQVLKDRGSSTRQETAAWRGQGPSWWRSLKTLSSRRYVDRIYRVAEEQLDKIANTNSPGSRCCATSGVIHLATVKRSRTGGHPVLVHVRRYSRRTSLRARSTAAIPRQCPTCGTGSSILKPKFRRLRPAAHYPEGPLHPGRWPPTANPAPTASSQYLGDGSRRRGDRTVRALHSARDSMICEQKPKRPAFENNLAAKRLNSIWR